MTYSESAPRAAFRFLLGQDGRLIQREGAGSLRLPDGYNGRVYLPLDRETIEPIWGTRDENGRFDGRRVNELQLRLAAPLIPGGPRKRQVSQKTAAKRSFLRLAADLFIDSIYSIS